MRNKYPGLCFVCGKWVAPGTGFFQRYKGQWLVHCRGCDGSHKKDKSDDCKNA